MSTFTCLHYHVVFSTKHRKPTIRPEWQQRLWQYMAGIVNGNKGHAYEIGGVEDHVHCLISIHQTVAIANFIRDLKASASGWAHNELGANDLWWQDGYAAFTVSHSGLDQVREYIRTQ